MQQALEKLLELLLVLLRIPKNAPPAVIAEAKQAIEDHKATIDTMHGDSELAHPNVTTLIDDLTEIAATSDPDEEYSETPEPSAEEEESEPAEESEPEKKPTEGEEEADEAEEDEKEKPKKKLIKKEKPAIKKRR